MPATHAFVSSRSDKYPPHCLNSDAGALLASPLLVWRRWVGLRCTIFALVWVSASILDEPAVARELVQREEHVVSQIDATTRDLERRQRHRERRMVAHPDSFPQRQWLPRSDEIDLPGAEEEVEL